MERKKLLEVLLRERNEHPERTSIIDARIEKMFKVKKAIYIQDMSGFSRLVIKHGIIHYLSMIQQMQDVVLPLIIENHGKIIKTEADNVYATFDNPNFAVKTAKEAIKSFNAMNIILPNERDIYLSIGIGYGEFLDLEHDYFGNEVNLASKLGEDIAEKNEILLTERAYLKYSNKKECKFLNILISGMSLNYYKLENKYN